MKKVKQKKITKILLIGLAMLTGLSNSQLPTALAFTNYTEQSTKVDVSFESVKEIGKETITIKVQPKDMSVIVTGIQLPNGEFVNSDQATYVAEAIGDYNFTVFYKEVMEVTPPANDVEVELPNTDEEVQLPSQEEEVTEGEEQPVEDSNESIEEEQPVEDNNEPTEEEQQPSESDETLEEVAPVMFIPSIDTAFAAEIDGLNGENNATVTVEKSETFTYHVKELLENSDIDALFSSFYDEETNTEIVSIKAEVSKGDANIQGILLPNGVFVEGTEAEYEANQNGRYEFTVKYTENTSENILTQKFYYDVKQIDRSLFSVSGDFTFNPDTQTIISYSPHASKDVVIPEAINGVEVLHIGDNAFANQQLTSVEFPDTVLTIGNSAFYNNPGLTSITLSTQVETIGESAFQQTGIEEIEIPSTVKSIENNTFRECTQLRTVTLNEGLISIGSYAFEQSGVTSITLPNSVTEMGEGAFLNCRSLIEVNFNNQMTAIPNKAFMNTGITKLVIPANINTIGEFAFNSTTRLKEITFNEGLEIVGQRAFSNCNVEEIVLPDSLRSFGEGAFGGIYSLRKLSLGANLTNIPDYGFASAFQLREIVFSDKIEVIGKSAFSYTEYLTTLTLPNSLITIGEEAFYQTALEEVNIPSSVTTIGKDAFAFSSLKTINILGKDEGTITGAPWGASKAAVMWADTLRLGEYIYSPAKEKIVKYVPTVEPSRPESIYISSRLYDFDTGVSYPVTVIGANAFSGYELRNVNFPDSVKVIEEGAFEGCKISDAVFGEGLEIIEDRAFRDNHLYWLFLPERLLQSENWHLQIVIA